MTNAEFDALAKLLRLRGGSVTQAARLHLVDGMPVADAARAAGGEYRLAWRAVRVVQAGLALARTAAGLG